MIFSVRKAEYGDIKEMSNILNGIINEGGLTLQNSTTTPVDFKRNYFTNPYPLQSRCYPRNKNYWLSIS